MSDPQQLSLDLGKPHRNHYLFSDHYLDEVLRRERVWSEAQPQAAHFLAFLRELYAREGRTLEAYSEAQLEDHWIKPILGALGHSFETQATVPGLDRGIKKPDYVFFADETARQDAAADQRSEAYARHALAVGEVKAWSVNLSKKTGGAAVFDNNNPMFQIDYYLKAMGVTWGIAANGRFWRLVNRDSSYKLDVYFEVDLLDALTTTDATRALAVANYFVVLFGQAAFRPDPGGATRLDDVLRGSQTYARALESDLRDNAYKALEQLIIGFFAPAANRLDPHDPAHRDAVYRHSLLLLYRLLFLFYGESRGLLPSHNEAYRALSLTALGRVAARTVDDHKVDTLPPMTRTQWNHLEQLFTVINGDDVALNAYLGVPRYNGGLFDPQRHPFLAQKFVGDRHLIRALDYLARRRKTDAGGKFAGFEPVDYRTLGVRQLGSIYEGLLEYKVSVAAEAMVTVRKGGKETWLPARERGKAKSIETKEPGELYLATDKGERKATGSYYTPDYIVKYIVEQTLGPLVEEARRRAESAGEQGSGGAGERGSRAAQRFEAEVLALNVLDPAMGSGHFLVEATDFLARALATAEWTTGEGPGSRGQVPGEEPATLVPGTWPLAPSEESDLTYWRRRVVEACIYGVDKNELAVELAKLSLWLVTVAADKPLSFLDHHLRHGDSLIGAWLKDLDGPPAPSPSARKRGGAGGQGRGGEEERLFDESAFTTNAGQAVGGAAAIEAMLTDDLADVHAKEQLFRELHDSHLGRWRQLADLWVSAWFGNTMSAAEYADLARRIQGKPATMSDAQAARYLSHPAVAANDYFHWEMEFPEVFFDRYGRPKGTGAGFDAVVGNPPYVRQEQLQVLKPFLSVSFPEVFTGTADLFVYFFSRAIELLKLGGSTSFISSNSWLRANYATNLRTYLRQTTQVETIIDLGDNKVFADAPDVYPAVHIVSRKQVVTDLRTEVAVFGRGEGLVDFADQVRAKTIQVLISTQPDSGWHLSDTDSDTLSKKLTHGTTELGEISIGQIYRGVTTGFNDAFVIDASTREKLIHNDPKSGEIVHPFVKGAELRPWYQDSASNHWLIFTRRGIDIDRYSAIHAHLDQYRMSLEPRGANRGSSDIAVGRKPGAYKWFEIQDSVDYYEAFDKHKIVWPDIAKYPRFSWDHSGLFIGNTGYILVTEDKWLLAYLASRCAWFLISKSAISLGERAGIQRYRLVDQYMRRLPVPLVPLAEQSRLANLADSLTAMANARHRLHYETRHRVSSDLGSPEVRLNEKLTNWWELEFADFRREVKLALKREILVRERSDWEHYMADARKSHEAYTADIVRMETELNAIVYSLFELSPQEIKTIEDSTKYRYGEI